MGRKGLGRHITESFARHLKTTIKTINYSGTLIKRSEKRVGKKFVIFNGHRYKGNRPVQRNCGKTTKIYIEVWLAIILRSN